MAPQMEPSNSTTPPESRNLERIAIRNLVHPAQASPDAGCSQERPDATIAGVRDAGDQLEPRLREADDTSSPNLMKRHSARLAPPHGGASASASASGAILSRQRAGPIRGWTPEEDELLLSLVRQFGEASWSRYASEYFGSRRTGSALRSRYFNNLFPGRDATRPWSADEDAVLIHKQQELGNNWVTIAVSLPGRSGNDAKNRFHVLVRHQVASSPSEPHARGSAP
mmetsp:Transcript_11820/g.31794  ORF Transcript_11820/g.31794 Transcript_11820/m.31794 type:complete len:226 (+) Transcript_11820:321-998(+)